MEIRVLNFNELRQYHLCGEIVVNCTSRNRKDIFRNLSPFFLGPVECYGGLKAQNVENAWQYSKVYAKYADENGNPTEEYFRWRDCGWRKTWADRHPMGAERPLYSYWETENGPAHYGYVEARKNIYVPIYAKAVIHTPAFQELKRLYESGEPLILVDFDAYDHLKLGYSSHDIINDPYRKMGHGFVLKFMLEGAFPNIIKCS